MVSPADSLEVLLQKGLGALGAGRLGDAVIDLRLATRKAPDSVQAWQGLGVALCQSRDFRKGIEAFERALVLSPGSREIRSNLGCAFRDHGQLQKALKVFQQVVEQDPVYAPGHNDCGVVLAKLGRHADALSCYEQALRLAPSYFEALYNAGNALAAVGNPAAALTRFDEALRLDPRRAVAWANRGHALSTLQRFEDALHSYERSLSLGMANVAVYLGAARALEQLFRLDEAIFAYRRALELDPDDADVLYRMGFVLQRLGRYPEALTCFLDLDRKKARYPGSLGMIATIRGMMCDWSQDAEIRTRIRAGLDRGEATTTPFAFLGLNGAESDQSHCAAVWSRTPASGIVDCAPAPDFARPADRVRVGYLSADFHEHATLHLAAGLFEHHDRKSFEIFAFSHGPDFNDDARKRLLAAVEHFEDLRLMSDDAAAARIRECGIDILVDLKGYTADSRLGILARRPAPLQLSYLGYPGTLSSPIVDYVIADETVIPPASKPAYHEQIIWLPHSYQINDNARSRAVESPARQALSLPEESFVFCCFNSSYKITREFFDIWCRILMQVEGSVIWLLAENEAAVTNLRREATARGVDPARLVFAERVSPAQHRARIPAADLFLDTLPYNAHTTASDALWSGLPVLTCRGGSFSGRVGASLLNAMGLPELIAETTADYEAKALLLAKDPLALSVIREKVHAARDAAPLFDTAATTRGIESAYATIFARAHAGNPPASFKVEPLDAAGLPSNR